MLKKIITDISLLFFSGFLLLLSTPGYDIYILAYFALTPAFYVFKNGYIKPVISGLIFGILFYSFALNWVITSVSHFGNAPIPIGVAVLLLFSFYLSLYWAILAHFIKMKDNILLLSLIFVVLEIIRSILFTGFPWLNLGLTQYNNTIVIGLASLQVNVGISLLLVMSNLLFLNFIQYKKFKYILFCIILISLCHLLGYIIKINDSPIKHAINIGIAQPSYKQETKWIPSQRYSITKQIKEMIDKAHSYNNNLVVLPESLFPLFIEEDHDLMDYLINLSYKKPLIFGNIRREYNNNHKYKYYNSVFFFDKGSYDVYDKVHLVPFGEYFPFKTLFKPINYYFFGDSDNFSSGNKLKIFNIGDIKLGPLICYEGAFSDFALDLVDQHADIIIVVTNDSWFGNGIGRNQHLAIAVVRAVETGKNIIRASQSGISAFITPKGDIAKHLDVGQNGIIEYNVEVSPHATFFSIFKYLWLVILLLFFFFIFIKKNRKRIAKKWFSNYINSN